jgi:hypothetical protein
VIRWGVSMMSIIDKQRVAVVATRGTLGYTFSLADGRSLRPSLSRIRRASEKIDLDVAAQAASA